MNGPVDGKKLCSYTDCAVNNIYVKNDYLGIYSTYVETGRSDYSQVKTHYKRLTGN